MSDKNKAKPVGGNIIANPNSSLFRSSEYVVLTNQQNASEEYCPLFNTSKVQCDLPVFEFKKYSRSCHGCVNPNDKQSQTQKIINNEVRLPSSLHMSNLASSGYVNKTSSSVIKNVPTRGNSTKSSITSLKPGSTSAPGKGVHVKHGSYHRRLLNIKNKCIC